MPRRLIFAIAALAVFVAPAVAWADACGDAPVYGGTAEEHVSYLHARDDPAAVAAGVDGAWHMRLEYAYAGEWFRVYCPPGKNPYDNPGDCTTVKVPLDSGDPDMPPTTG